MTAYNRGQVLYRLAEMMEARARRPRARAAPGRDEVERGDRSRRLVRRLGRQARAGARLLEPGRRAVLQLHDAGADRRRRRSSRPTSRRSLGLVSRLAPGARRRQHRRRRSRPRRIRSPRSSSPRRSPPPTSRRRRQRPHRLRATSSRRGSPAHMDVNAIDLTGADGDAAELERARGRERQARRPRPRRRAEPVGDRGVPRAQDRLAPDRPLSRVVLSRGSRTPPAESSSPPARWPAPRRPAAGLARSPRRCNRRASVPRSCSASTESASTGPRAAGVSSTIARARRFDELDVDASRGVAHVCDRDAPARRRRSRSRAGRALRPRVTAVFALHVAPSAERRDENGVPAKLRAPRSRATSTQTRPVASTAADGQRERAEATDRARAVDIARSAPARPTSRRRPSSARRRSRTARPPRGRRRRGLRSAGSRETHRLPAARRCRRRSTTSDRRRPTSSLRACRDRQECV